MANNPRPLAGKRVVVTRAPGQASELVRRLEELGAQVLLLPIVSFSEPADPAPLEAALRTFRNFDWVLFTSQNAVRFVARRAQAMGLDSRALQSPRPLVAAVGPATAKAATEEGFRIDHVAAQHSGVELAKELWSVVTGRRVLLPRSDRAGSDLPEALRQAGAQVVEVVAYRTCSPTAADESALAQVRRGEVDVISFASPSAFQHLAEEIGLESLGRLAERILLAAIGPTTARAIRDAGLPVSIEAREATTAGLAAAVADYFEQQLPSGVRSR